MKQGRAYKWPIIVTAAVVLSLALGVVILITGFFSASQRICRLEHRATEAANAGEQLHRTEVEEVLRGFHFHPATVGDIPPEYEMQDRGLPVGTLVEYSRFGASVFIVYTEDGSVELLIPVHD